MDATTKFYHPDIYGFKENRGFTWSQYLTCSHASLRLTATDAFTFSMAKPSCISTPCFPQETAISVLLSKLLLQLLPNQLSVIRIGPSSPHLSAHIWEDLLVNPFTPFLACCKYVSWYLKLF
jgi:hypothetical protein